MINFKSALLASVISLGIFAPAANAGSGIIHTQMESTSGATKISFRGTACNPTLTRLMAAMIDSPVRTFATLYSDDIFQLRANISAGGREYIRTACLFGSNRSNHNDFVGLFIEDSDDTGTPESCYGVIGIEERSPQDYTMFLTYMGSLNDVPCPVEGETSQIEISGIGTTGYKVGNSGLAYRL